MMASPHFLIEGVIITCLRDRLPTRRSSTCAARSCTSTAGCCRRSRRPAPQGYLGTDVLGSGLDLDIVAARRRRRVHLRRGDGAARLARGPARPAAAQAAVPRGRRACTRARPWSTTSSRSPSVPSIVDDGADWFASMGTEQLRPGYGLFSLSGHVTRPGQYEAPLGITLRELLEMAGGIREGHELKFWTPGGSSTPIFTAEHLDVAARLRVGRRGRARCSARARCRSSTRRPRWSAPCCAGPSSTRTSPAASARRAARARTGWCRCCAGSRPGRARAADIDKLLDICDNILGRSFCALGDGATSPITSSIQYFRDEFDAGTSPQRRLFPSDPVAVHPTSPELVCADDRDHPDHRPTTAWSRRSPPSRGRRDLVTLTIDGIEVSVPKGTLVIRAAEQLGIAIPRFCDHPLLAPGRRLPPVPGRGLRRPGPRRHAARDAEAAGRLHARGHAGHAGQDAAHVARWPRRPSTASWSCCSSTTRSTARSATRAASARCRTRR